MRSWWLTIERMQWTPQKREEFLISLRTTPNVTVAARKIGASRSMAYKLRETDPEFARAWDEALEEGIEALEAEAHRRAFEGVNKPITFQGVVTDTFKEYSDTLAIFLLKAHKPERYRERSEVSVKSGDLAEAIVNARRNAGS